MPLVERVCEEEGVRLERKPLLVSMLYALVTFRRTPVIFVNGRLMSQGRVPSLEALRGWVREARATGI